MWYRARSGAALALLAAAFAAGAAAAAEFKIQAASYLGTGNGDKVIGCRIQSDGSILLAAHLSPDALKGLSPDASGGDTDPAGCVLRLSPDGRRLLSIYRLAAEIRDLAIDGDDRPVVALGRTGCAQLDPKGLRTLWIQALEEDCDRVDAGRDGHVVALAGRQIAIFDPAGKPLGATSGRYYTNDVCIDSASRTVVFVGFRNEQAPRGNDREGVQISYVQAVGYDGATKWCDYDWSIDPTSDRFINRPGDNTAHTRGYRCSIGRDGKLYVAFEAAGANHIFRYDPADIQAKVALAGGDAHHQFHDSGPEHKTVFCKFEPATGAYLAGQQFCGRLPSGRANAVRMKEGEIAADEAGRVCVAGLAGARIPLTIDPLPAKTPKGGPFVLMMSPDFTTRLACARLSVQGVARAVDARTIDGRATIVFAGDTAPGLHAVQPVQKSAAGPAGFFAVLRSE